MAADGDETLETIALLEEAYDDARAQAPFPSPPGAGLLAAGERWSAAVWQAAENAGALKVDETDAHRGLRLAARPVFVCGAHRCGSTLVRDLLDGHPELSVLPSEGSYLTSLAQKLAPLQEGERLRFFGKEWIRRLANPTARPPFWLLGRTNGDRSPYVRFARRLIGWWPRARASCGEQRHLWPQTALALAWADASRDRAGGAPKARRWVDKTPTNELHLATLRAEFPNAKVVHVVRNPLAVYASRKRLEERSLGRFPGARRALRDLAISLRVAAEERDRGDRSDYLLVRYEELLAAPQEVTARLADFLGIEPGATLLRPTVMGIPVSPNSSFASNQAAGIIATDNPIDPESVLTASERAAVAVYAATFAARLGYPPAPQNVIRRELNRCRFLLLHALQRFVGRS